MTRAARILRRNAARVAGAALILVVAGSCSGDDSSGPAGTEPPSPTTTEVVPETTTTTTTATTLPEDPLADDVRFIEVSARIGVGDDAEVVALAVDTPTLEAIETADPDDAPAWCTGADREITDVSAPILDYLVRVSAPAVDNTMGGASRFELTAPLVQVEAGPAPASFELVIGGRDYAVAVGTLDLGEVATGGTFAGTAADGTVIEGAFLCG